MELDKEMEILNKEMLKEKQRMLELGWKERRKQETRRILMEAAKSTLEDVLSWTLEEVGRKEATRRAERVMKAKLLSSTARMRALTMSSPAKRKCEHKESATPSKRRRNIREAGGRVGMEERGSNHPKLYSIFKKLSLPGTTLLEQASRTSPSPGASTASQPPVPLPTTPTMPRGGTAPSSSLLLPGRSLLPCLEAGSPKFKSLEIMSSVMGPGTHATTLPGRKTTLTKVKTKKWRKKKDGSYGWILVSSIPKEVVEGGKASSRKGEGGGSKAKQGILFWEEQAGAQQLLDRNTAEINEGKVKTDQHSQEPT